MLTPLDERALRAHRSRARRVRLPPELIGHLDGFFGEINAALIAIAIGLAVLDFVFLLRWEYTAALSR